MFVYYITHSYTKRAKPNNPSALAPPCRFVATAAVRSITTTITTTISSGSSGGARAFGPGCGWYQLVRRRDPRAVNVGGEEHKVQALERRGVALLVRRVVDTYVNVHCAASKMQPR